MKQGQIELFQTRSYHSTYILQVFVPFFASYTYMYSKLFLYLTGVLLGTLCIFCGASTLCIFVAQGSLKVQMAERYISCVNKSSKFAILNLKKCLEITAFQDTLIH
jgi:hypothetical protein